MKKVLIITYYWPPSGGAGVQRWVKFIKYFSKYNIKPFVITVDPKLASYPLTDSTFKNDIPEDTNVYLTKTFEPYTYYKKINKKEIPYAGFANESNPNFIQKTARFIRGNFFIPDARKGWNKFAKNDDMKKYQLLLYKQYFSEQYGIPLDKIEVKFFI